MLSQHRRNFDMEPQKIQRIKLIKRMKLIEVTSA